jgi:hypothetical protein
MPLPARVWIVSCPACSIVIGEVQDGRFLHDPDCSRPLSIGAGVLRCCQCSGRLTGREQPAVVVDVEEETTTSTVLRFVRRAEPLEDLRQRL